ncbi:sphingosine-1-phosphate lyase [Moniliophthora roreri MCA 2997]|uniref:sphinganine-1-phosphate aldolase n=2 Tax=Moniliophthora roreri TaxID=221103 RepID=V2XR73_MONRO|nr:sphingosine-1-phosphate lyase [Moniliophthora roreri MCA 2997]
MSTVTTLTTKSLGALVAIQNRLSVLPPAARLIVVLSLLHTTLTLLSGTVESYRHLRARGIHGTFSEAINRLSQWMVRVYLKLPVEGSKKARQRIETEMGAAKLDIEKRLVGDAKYIGLPDEGKPIEWILAEFDRMDALGQDHKEGEGENKALTAWEQGKVSGAVYHGHPSLSNVISTAYARYCLSNPLHPDLFPAVRKMEAEIVRMCLELYNNPDGAGTMTSGGTESIVMAVKTYRDWAKETKGITKPEMILPASAHAAFDKAAAYFGIKIHQIPVNSVSRKVDMKRVRKAINPNTILLVGSAPNFPDGNMDPISELSQLALKYKIGLHVDCCLGSFIMPYLEKTGLSEGLNGKYKLEPFDFRVPGVTSISCDTHKYGFSPKGSSVIMYRSAELRRHQYFVMTGWSGGLYASPSMSGSRPGALIAGTWAAMMSVGNKGYLDSCTRIVNCARNIAETIRNTVPELYILGSPPASVIAFGSKHPRVNVLELGDMMSKKGWHLNALSNPPAVHIACTMLTPQASDSFISDLKECIREVKNRVRKPGEKEGTMVALYGLGKSSAVGPSMVGELAEAFLDALYKI